MHSRYIRATINVKSGKMAEFIAIMSTFAPRCKEVYGLELVMATRSDANQDVVVHCWKIPDHPSLDEIVKELSADPGSVAAQSCVEHESAEIVVALPYSP